MTENLQREVAIHIDRSRVYRALAQIFSAPDVARFSALQERDLPELCEAIVRLVAGTPEAAADLEVHAKELRRLLQNLAFSALDESYYAAFDVSGKSYCPPTETTHTSDTPGHGLTRNVELADIAGFYRAFGVELSEQAERVDCITAELEFLQLVAAKQAIACEALCQDNAEAAEQLEICRNAAQAFLKDHLTRWLGKFVAALERTGAAEVYVTAARLARDFAQFDTQSA